MKFAFHTMRLEAGSLYSLIANWAEMQLTVTEDAARITGYGYCYDIAEAFTALVLDWEAAIVLPEEKVNLEPGTYELYLLSEKLYAFRNQEPFFLPDRPVAVEVWSAPE